MKGVLSMARLTWDEMVSTYPDQWVAVKDAEMDGADIISGEVVAAKSDRAMRKFRILNRHTGLVFRRTSDGVFSLYNRRDADVSYQNLVH